MSCNQKKVTFAASDVFNDDFSFCHVNKNKLKETELWLKRNKKGEDCIVFDLADLVYTYQIPLSKLNNLKPGFNYIVSDIHDIYGLSYHAKTTLITLVSLLRQLNYSLSRQKRTEHPDFPLSMFEIKLAK